MGRFDLQEHLSCSYYVKTMDEGFRKKKKKMGESMTTKRTISNQIIFIIEGELEIAYGAFATVKGCSGQMFFIPRYTSLEYTIIKEGLFIVASYNTVTHFCITTAISALSKTIHQVEYEFKPFEIKETLVPFLNLLYVYILDGVNCRHIHDIKIEELFFIFKVYYKKEELAAFLYPMVGTSLDFRNKVFNYCHQSGTVRELAELCGISLKTFNRQFVAEFGEAPSLWMQKRLIEDIKYRLADKRIPLKELVEEFNLSSVSHLVRLCKKYLGETPGEFRRNLGNDMK